MQDTSTVNRSETSGKPVACQSRQELIAAAPVEVLAADGFQPGPGASPRKEGSVRKLGTIGLDRLCRHKKAIHLKRHQQQSANRGEQQDGQYRITSLHRRHTGT